MVSDMAAPACQAPWLNLLIDNYGGQIASVLPNETAFPHREAAFQLQYNIYWNGKDNEGTTPLAELLPPVDEDANGIACTQFLDTAYHNMGDYFAQVTSC